MTILKLLAAGACIFTVTALPGLAVLFKNGFSDFRPYTEHSFRKSLWYLKKNKLITIQKKNKKNIINISKRGKKRLQNFKFQTMSIPKQTKWDYKWRVVLFDVPERKKTARDYFRRKLKKLGFCSLQKSTYVYPFPCKNEVYLIKNSLGINPYVYYLTTPHKELPVWVNNYFKRLLSN